MESILEVFIKISENEGIKITQLEEKIGASKGVLSRAIKNNSDIQAKWLLKLVENYPQYNEQWLLTGEGEMLKSSSEHVAMTVPDKTMKAIPLVNATAIGGYGNNVFSFEERDVKDYYVIPKFKHKQVDFMIEVEGSSMYPKYNSGDVVACRIIKERNFIQWNKTHVIATREQGIIIKRIKPSDVPNSLLMISDNESYDPFNVPEEEIEGLAIVVGVIRLE